LAWSRAGIICARVTTAVRNWNILNVFLPPSKKTILPLSHRRLLAVHILSITTGDIKSRKKSVLPCLADYGKIEPSHGAYR
jgi:hypothetical protein